MTRAQLDPGVVAARIALVLIGLGIVVYGFLAYRVALAGGFTETGLRATCAQAATGRADALYRLGENLTVERTWLPLSATCRWSGGSAATLVPASVLSWLGPALVLAGLVIAIAVRIRRR